MVVGRQKMVSQYADIGSGSQKVREASPGILSYLSVNEGG